MLEAQVLIEICVDELHLKPAAHVDAFIPVEQSTFSGWMKDAHPCSFVGRARADCIELISEAGRIIAGDDGWHSPNPKEVVK